MIEIRNYIWGIIAFTLIVVSGVTMLGIFNDSDSTYTDNEKFTQFNKSFNKLAEVTREVEEIQEDVEGAEAEQGLFGVLNSLISTSWNSLKLLISSFSFMSSGFAGLNYVFGIPVWITGLISLVVVVLFGFAIYKAIFRSS